MKSRRARVLLGVVVCLLAVPLPGRLDGPAVESAAEASVPSVPAADLPAAGASDVDVSRSAIDLAAAETAGVPADPLKLALGAVACATSLGEIDPPRTLTLIDYSRPSVEPRLWVYDLASGELLFEELVAHGRNTGENLATRFSDTMNSHQSSLGLFVARDTYVGSNGYSLRMDGLEPGFNGRARDRAIVMHGAWYVDPALAEAQGRLGRSWGCPALREAVARNVIDTVRDGGVIFSYYPDSGWLRGSRLLNGCNAAGTAIAGR